MKLRHCLPLLALAAGLAASPAFATVTHFDLGFDKPLNKTATSVSFATTVDGITLNVKVTAVQLFDGQFRLAQELPIASYGGHNVLGAISPNDQGGQQNFHQVDNVDGVDFLVFQFDKAVTLDKISREGVAAGSGRPATRSNVSLGFGNADPNSLDLASLLGIVNGGLTTIEGPVAEGTLPTGGDKTTFDTDTFSIGGAGNLWLVGADYDTAVRSGFKLATLGVAYDPTVPSVPEPAVWAMLMLGFGLVGGAMRRRGGLRQVAA